jgi:hypothetical protein
MKNRLACMLQEQLAVARAVAVKKHMMCIGYSKRCRKPEMLL